LLEDKALLLGIDDADHHSFVIHATENCPTFGIQEGAYGARNVVRWLGSLLEFDMQRFTVANLA
jgi:hypothetical protein